jgi:HEPN domain-containing protein
LTTRTLAQSYLVKGGHRLRALEVLMEAEAFSDVVREAQEIVELALKGILRQAGVEPPKQNDVGRLLAEFRERLPEAVRGDVERMAAISRWLRKEREFSFYGDEDFVPTEEYARGDAERALADARFVVARASVAIPLPPPQGPGPDGPGSPQGS